MENREMILVNVIVGDGLKKDGSNLIVNFFTKFPPIVGSNISNMKIRLGEVFRWVKINRIDYDYSHVYDDPEISGGEQMFVYVEWI